MEQKRWVWRSSVTGAILLLGLLMSVPLLADFSYKDEQTNLDENLRYASEYVVRPGDTLFGIARRFGVTVDAIVVLNQIPDARLIHAGQTLQIPSNTAVQPPLIANTATPHPIQPGEPIPTVMVAQAQSLPAQAGTIYFVRPGDSLFHIAGRFNTTVHEILAANTVSNPNLIFNGQRLIIPGEVIVPVVLDNATAVSTATQPPLATSLPSPTAVSSEFELIWPNDYRGLYKRFRYGHGAIDIAMPIGSSVLAAASGVVEFAGWHNAGFGYLIIIDHRNGTRTLYAHNNELLVETDQEVRQGEQIALSGSTGNSTHPHVHFSITENGRLIDPCVRLPGGC